MLILSRLGIDPAVRWGDIHKGKTAVVVGNGGSLETTPRELLHKYISFGCNLIHMLPFQPTYFSCVGTKYLLGYAGEMYETAKNAEIVFIGDQYLNKEIPELQRLYALDNVQLIHEGTATFPGEYFMTGGTVTYVNLKIAYFMGFDTALLVGCDHDSNYEHFYGNHINKVPANNEWNDMTYHYFVASEVYKEAGKRIVNLSNPSVLNEFFERGDIEEWK